MAIDLLNTTAYEKTEPRNSVTMRGHLKLNEIFMWRCLIKFWWQGNQVKLVGTGWTCRVSCPNAGRGSVRSRTTWQCTACQQPHKLITGVRAAHAQWWERYSNIYPSSPNRTVNATRPTYTHFYTRAVPHWHTHLHTHTHKHTCACVCVMSVRVCMCVFRVFICLLYIIYYIIK